MKFKKFHGHFENTEIKKTEKTISEMINIKILVFLLISTPYALQSTTDCTKLRTGQFLCPDPDSNYKYIDAKTQSVIGCNEEGIASGENSEFWNKYQ